MKMQSATRYIHEECEDAMCKQVYPRSIYCCRRNSILSMINNPAGQDMNAGLHSGRCSRQLGHSTCSLRIQQVGSKVSTATKATVQTCNVPRGFTGIVELS